MESGATYLQFLTQMLTLVPILIHMTTCYSGIDSTTGRNDLQDTLKFYLYFSHLQSSFWHKPDPSDAYSHRSKPPNLSDSSYDLSDSSTTLQIWMLDCLIESHRSIKHLMTYPHCCTPGSWIYIFYHICLHYSDVNLCFITFLFIFIVPTHPDLGSGSISWIPLSSTYCSKSSCVVSPFISLLFHCLLFQIFPSFTLHKPCTLQTK